MAGEMVDEVTMDGSMVHPDELQQRLATIVKPYYQSQQPLVVKGAFREAPATKLWSSWEYWERTVVNNNSNDESESESDPMVSVEIGGSYGTEGSERAEIPFSSYLQFLQLFEQRHGREGFLPGDDDKRATTKDIPAQELVYMAQNDLLAALYKDVVVPDFCQTGSEDTTAEGSRVGLGRLYSVMMWLGPRGCVSPLHYDPLDNCFLQHVGRKRVLLFDPAANGAGWHYAGHEGQQSNTSPIDPEVLDAMDLDDDAQTTRLRLRYPLFFEEAPPRLECLLEPGDFLYIPAKWWHHVRSIDSSASVNVWWR